MFGLKGSGGMLQGRHFYGERERERARESEGKELQRRIRGEEEGFAKFEP